MTKPGTIQGREEFLSRISSKLGRESQLTTAPVHETRGVPDFHRDKSFTADEKLIGFTENWSKLNGKFRLVSKANAAAEIATYLLEVIEEHQVSNVSRWQESKLDNLQLDKPLDDAGIAVVPWGELDEHDDRVPQASTFPDDSKWIKREPLMRAVERCT